jgi:hypothetical protein
MNPCTPIPVALHRMAPLWRARPRHSVHYAVSHKTHAAAGHHAATGHPVSHLPVIRHHRPVVHHAPPAPADSGACGVSDISRKLHGNGGPGAGVASGPVSGAAVGGLAAGGAAVGIGAAAALAQDGSLSPHGGAGGPGFGSPGFGMPGFGSPGYGAPGGGHPGGGSGSGGGGQPMIPPGVPVISHGSTPTSPVSVPEPSSLFVLTAALLALLLTRWAVARR